METYVALLIHFTYL